MDDWGWSVQGADTENQSLGKSWSGREPQKDNFRQRAEELTGKRKGRAGRAGRAGEIRQSCMQVDPKQGSGAWMKFGWREQKETR